MSCFVRFCPILIRAALDFCCCRQLPFVHRFVLFVHPLLQQTSGLKNRQGTKMQYSDRHCKYPTEL